MRKIYLMFKRADNWLHDNKIGGAELLLIGGSLFFLFQLVRIIFKF